MNSNLPKVLHNFAGKPLVHHVIEQAGSVGSQQTVLVIGHGREHVIEATRGMAVEYVVQERQLGTGDAVRACKPLLGNYPGDVLILSGDVPLLTSRTIQAAYDVHQSSGAAATVFTFRPPSADGYGRIIRGADGSLVRIVEHKDATEAELAIGEVNAGIYFFQTPKMYRALELVTNDNAAGEFYLTDTILILGGRGEKLAAFLVADPLEVEGVNSPDQLRTLEAEWLRRRSS